MTDNGFQVARLIPVGGIGSAVEAETRATSALLAVMSVVRDFSVALLAPLGASAARKASVGCFIEATFKLDDGTVVRPDGIVQVSYGSSEWTAIVEVKTGHDLLDAEQLNRYLTLAREQGMDAILTVSNEIAAGDQHPCDGVKVRANSRVRLAHLSWTEVLAHAVRTKVHRGVEDPEQAWILGELIRYLEHPASGALAFDDMGPTWVAVRDAAREGTLRRSSPEARDIARRWDQLVRFAALRLGSATGVDVQPVVPRTHADPRLRSAHVVDQLVDDGMLSATVRVPGAAGNLELAADLRARQLTVSTFVGAPQDRGSRARVTWLVRQLGTDAPAGLQVEAWGRNARQPVMATLAEARDDRDRLLDPDRREIGRFRLVERAEMGRSRKDGGRTAGFAESVTGLLEHFYAGVVQEIVPWSPRPPQARGSERAGPVADEPIADAAQLEGAIGAAEDAAAQPAERMVEAPIPVIIAG